MPSSTPPERWPADWPFPYDAPPVESRDGMVASTDVLASRAGAEVLADGGNAVDAAVAVSFALAVVNPEAGNVGGSGFLLVRLADGTEAALDYRGVAPAAATPDMFLDAEGRLGEASEVGHRAVGVPGSVMGLWQAHRRFGALPWDRLLEPAVTLAEGFEVTARFIRSYHAHIVEGLRRFTTSAEIFLPGDEVPGEGDTFRQSDLARTLERIRDRGPDDFYRGETADLIVDEMRRGGGLLSHEDLASYRAVWREPVGFGYRGHTVLSMPPPSSGGVALAAIAGMMEALEGGRGFGTASTGSLVAAHRSGAAGPGGPGARRGDAGLEGLAGALAWHGADHVHRLAEVWRRVFADRNHYLADPDALELPVAALVSPEYAAWRAGGIGARATASADLGPGLEAWRRAGGAGEGARAASPIPRTPRPPKERHTTHVSIVDRRGGAVSVTTTLNTWYGSKLVAAGTGVLLNNEMDDFTAAPGVPNHFGLVQGAANAIAPGKRMLSAMSPTIVLGPGGGLHAVVGTPGGSTIITTVWQVLSNLLDAGMPLAAAVAAPRVHHQHLPDHIHVEPGGLPAEVVAELRARGHRVVERAEWSGDVQAVTVGPGGVLGGVADPRRGGVAVGV